MNLAEDRTFKPGSNKRVQIVRHHNKWLNNQIGTILGKASGMNFYGWKVWLEKEQITVFVNEFNLIPSSEKITSWVDILEIRWKVWLNNIAWKLHLLLRK